VCGGLSTVVHSAYRVLREEAGDESDRLEDQAADDDEEEHVCCGKEGMSACLFSGIRTQVIPSLGGSRGSLVRPQCSIPSLSLSLSIPMSDLFPRCFLVLRPPLRN
jgi:hypothetical protein